MAEYGKLKYAIENADGWVVRNLRRTGISVLPDCFIACEDDIRIAEKMLSMIIHEPVTVRKTEGGYICET